jgi:hypothetical protein
MHRAIEQGRVLDVRPSRGVFSGTRLWCDILRYIGRPPSDDTNQYSPCDIELSHLLALPLLIRNNTDAEVFSLSYIVIASVFLILDSLASAGLDRLCTQNNNTTLIVSMVESNIILSNGLRLVTPIRSNR